MTQPGAERKPTAFFIKEEFLSTLEMDETQYMIENKLKDKDCFIFEFEDVMTTKTNIIFICDGKQEFYDMTHAYIEKALEVSLIQNVNISYEMRYQSKYQV